MSNVGFFGKDGLKPFIGQIPLGQTVNRTDPNGWSDRYQVRIQGYDSAEGNKLSNKNLRWAIAVKPTSQGNGNKGSVGFSGGETVFGLWDPDSQFTLILGSLARSNPTVQAGAADQQAAGSLGFKLPNIFIQAHNLASSWNYKSGSDGTPRGQQKPYQPTQAAFTKGLNLLG